MFVSDEKALSRSQYLIFADLPNVMRENAKFKTNETAEPKIGKAFDEIPLLLVLGVICSYKKTRSSRLWTPQGVFEKILETYKQGEFGLVKELTKYAQLYIFSKYFLIDFGLGHNSDGDKDTTDKGKDTADKGKILLRNNIARAKRKITSLLDKLCELGILIKDEGSPEYKLREWISTSVVRTRDNEYCLFLELESANYGRMDEASVQLTLERNFYWYHFLLKTLYHVYEYPLFIKIRNALTGNSAETVELLKDNLIITRGKNGLDPFLLESFSDNLSESVFDRMEMKYPAKVSEANASKNSLWVYNKCIKGLPFEEKGGETEEKHKMRFRLLLKEWLRGVISTESILIEGLRVFKTDFVTRLLICDLIHNDEAYGDFLPAKQNLPRNQKIKEKISQKKV